MRNIHRRRVSIRELFRARSVLRVRSQAGRGRFRPEIDTMEDRTLLSTLTVLNANDAGPGSLRQAIVDAGDGDTINFDASLADTTISLGDPLVIDESLEIQGLGRDALTLSGGGDGRVLEIADGASVVVSRLTITGGVADVGGGILNVGSDL